MLRCDKKMKKKTLLVFVLIGMFFCASYASAETVGTINAYPESSQKDTKQSPSVSGERTFTIDLGYLNFTNDNEIPSDGEIKADFTFTGDTYTIPDGKFPVLVRFVIHCRVVQSIEVSENFGIYFNNELHFDPLLAGLQVLGVTQWEMINVNDTRNKEFDLVTEKKLRIGNDEMTYDVTTNGIISFGDVNRYWDDWRGWVYEWETRWETARFNPTVRLIVGKAIVKERPITVNPLLNNVLAKFFDKYPNVFPLIRQFLNL
jgi:hypothetical protein